MDKVLDASSKHSVLLIQADASQNQLPILRQVAKKITEQSQTLILFTIVTPPSYFGLGDRKNVVYVDWTALVPGYDHWSDPRGPLLNAIDKAPAGPVTLLIDSADVLSQDIESVSACYLHLKALLARIQSRPSPSRLLLSVSSTSPIAPLLIPPSFSSTLTHLSLHSPALIYHIATAYLTYPPPHSPLEKFWTLFSPAAVRGEGLKLAFFPSADSDLARSGQSGAYGRDARSGVAEVVTRGLGGSGGSRARAVDRSLEAWVMDEATGAVRGIKWDELEALKDLVGASRSRAAGGGDAAGDKGLPATDPVGGLDLPFNLSLTDSQQQARAQVPLPYAHQGQDVFSIGGQSQILYDPDSADDIDDDDPDEDLDI